MEYILYGSIALKQVCLVTSVAVVNQVIYGILFLINLLRVYSY